MSIRRLPRNDPRTLARDIPGLFDALFPQLVPGIVSYLNRRSFMVSGVEPISDELVASTSLQPSMLFEVAVAIAEQLIQAGQFVDFTKALDLAIERQQKHFDVRRPTAITSLDEKVARSVASNLQGMLLAIRSNCKHELAVAPLIPGYRWIASGVGDFSMGSSLIEVKCTSKHFSASDYRQVVTYWLLSYSAAVEHGDAEWSECILLNPRRNLVVRVPFDELVQIIGADRSKVELLELFSTMVENNQSG